MSRWASTVLATLALVAGSLTAAATTAPAGATTPCEEVSARHHGLLADFHLQSVTCATGHQVAHNWTGCRLSTDHAVVDHCTIGWTADGRRHIYKCTNQKALHAPEHYHVRCRDIAQVVTFNYYPHGR